MNIYGQKHEAKCPNAQLCEIWGNNTGEGTEFVRSLRVELTGFVEFTFFTDSRDVSHFYANVCDPLRCQARESLVAATLHQGQNYLIALQFRCEVRRQAVSLW